MPLNACYLDNKNNYSDENRKNPHYAKPFHWPMSKIQDKPKREKIKKDFPDPGETIFTGP